jgi:poly-gamma-glutamate synthesis protein (capsule biosynthesis protein)
MGRAIGFISQFGLAALIAAGALGVDTPPGMVRGGTSGAAAMEAAGDPYRIIWVGDILLGDSAQPELEQHGYALPFQHTGSLLDGDAVIGNAEGPITARTTPYRAEARWSYNADPRAATALADVGFRALSLANNHALDRGPDGLADTLSELRAAGIEPFGAGPDIEQAAAPLLIDTPHGRIGVVGLGPTGPNSPPAGPGQAGIARADTEAVYRGADLARAAGARWLVAYLHWGGNYAKVNARQRRLAADFAQAGYDLAVGHGPHSLQPVDIVNGMPVLYSVGNFAFGSRGRFSRNFPGYGLVVATSFGPDGLEAIELACIATDYRVVGFQPRPCIENEAVQAFDGLGPHVVRNESGAVIPL